VIVPNLLLLAREDLFASHSMHLPHLRSKTQAFFFCIPSKKTPSLPGASCRRLAMATDVDVQPFFWGGTHNATFLLVPFAMPRTSHSSLPLCKLAEGQCSRSCHVHASYSLSSSVLGSNYHQMMPPMPPKPFHPPMLFPVVFMGRGGGVLAHKLVSFGVCNSSCGGGGSYELPDGPL
jgi:hypothetical protein